MSPRHWPRLSLAWTGAVALLTACGTPPPAAPQDALPPMKEVCSTFTAEGPLGRFTWQFSKSTFPGETVPRGARLVALELAAKLKASRPPRPPEPRWTSIGPAPAMATTSERQDIRHVSGRVAAVAVDPGGQRHWLIGAAHGGIWETRKAGQSWAPRTDDQASLAMGAIAFAPSDPRIVYAGTGEAVFSRSTYGGEGLLKSQDGGRTWAPLAVREFSGVAFSDLAVDPSNPKALVAATAHAGVASTPGRPAPRGIWTSTHGGYEGTWVQRLPGDATSLVVHPKDFSQQYAGIGAVCGDARANDVYRSTEAGKSWHRIKGPWTAGGAVGRIELAIAPSRPDVLYVSIQRTPDADGNGGDLLGLWRTDDAWAATPAWREIASARTLGATGKDNYCAFQCWYSHVLSVDPQNPDALYAGGFELWRFDGSGWSKVSGDPMKPTGIHVDQHALAWAGGRLIVGNDGGVWSTGDGGRTWDGHNEGLATNQIWHGTIDPTDENVALAGSQDNGTARWTKSPLWRQVSGGDGGASAIAKDQPATSWALSAQRAWFYRTTDGAKLTFVGDPVFGAPALTKPFITPLEKCPHNDDVFVAGTVLPWRTDDFFSSATKGAPPAWTANGPEMPRRLRAMAFAPSDQTCRTYGFGTLDGQLRLTAVGGGPSGWKDLDPGGLLPKRVVTALAFDPREAKILYITLGGFDEATPGRPGHVFRTDDAFAPSPQWTHLKGTGTPNLPHNAIALSPMNPQVIYVGTDVGLWYTTDGGRRWDYMGPERGLPNVAVSEVRIHPTTGRVFAFTFGRGAFTLDGGPAAQKPPPPPAKRSP
jgi:photosystem II stability/assembly factor-like uncharacterized protein